MEALLLSAGFGTRLRPLTEKIPKPLIEVGSKPLIFWHLERLENLGFKRVFINTHYLHETFAEYLEQNWKGNLKLQLVHEKEILDTGGAVSNIQEFLNNEDLLVINSDLFLSSEFNLSDLITEHNKSTAEVTILVSKDTGNNFTKLFFDNDNYLLDIGGRIGINTNSVENNVANFLGVSILSNKFVAGLPPKGTKFSLTIDGFLDRLKKDNRSIVGFYFNGFWSDVGTLDRLDEVNKYLRS